MIAKTFLDKAGRIVVPKHIRDELQLGPGDALELETSDDRITLRPLRNNGALSKKHGVWVYHTGEPLSEATVQETLRNVRRERDETNLGKSR